MLKEKEKCRLSWPVVESFEPGQYAQAIPFATE